MSNEIDFDALAKEALENARKDRGLVEESFEQMRGALKIENQEDVQKTMLVGEKAVKLLELLTKTNAQIIQISQLAQKKAPKVQEDDDEEPSFTLADVLKAKEQSPDVEVRVEQSTAKTKKKTKEA
jgi:hypothetical protein